MVDTSSQVEIGSSDVTVEAQPQFSQQVCFRFVEEHCLSGKWIIPSPEFVQIPRNFFLKSPVPRWQE